MGVCPPRTHSGIVRIDESPAATHRYNAFAMLREIAGEPLAGDTPFVGRKSELESFARTLELALSGRRQVLLVSGEPGIGKSACAARCAAAAEERGALVLWGRCYEEPGAPPYWPWVQIIRAFVADSSPSEVELSMGAGVHEIASLVPELSSATALAGAGLSAAGDSRFRVFDAVCNFLAKASQQVPLVLILDNLHWADAPSLSLLEFASQELERSRVLLLGTYRDNEVSRKSPLLHSLGGLGKDMGVARLRLTGLDRDAIAELAASMLPRGLPASAVDAIHHQTDGNPLFVIELVKFLIEESRDVGMEPIAVRIPDGVREAIGRRLSRLPDSTNALLTTASVIGRSFTVAELGAVLASSLVVLLEQLQGAVESGLIETNDSSRTAYRFTHALIRETLYDEIPLLERLRLHGRVAKTLVALAGKSIEPVLSRIAHHFYEAAVIGHVDEAVDYAARAAEHGLKMHAYEDTLAHCDRVVEVLKIDAVAAADDRAARAHHLKGRVNLRLGRLEDAVTSLLHAVDAAKNTGNLGLLVDATGQLMLTTSFAPQGHLVPLLEKTLAALPEHEHACRARALAGLAFALRSSGDDARVDSLVDQTIAEVERRPELRAPDVMVQLVILALRGRPETLGRRLEIGARFADLDAQTSDDDALLDLSCWHLLHLLEAGRVDDCASLASRQQALGRHYVLKRHFSETTSVTLALLRGEWIDIESRIEALLEQGSRMRSKDAESVYGAQMFALKRDRGALEELRPLVQSLVGARREALWTPGLIALCADLGLAAEAHELLAAYAGEAFERLPRDDMFVACLVYCSEACYALGDAGRAAAAYVLLLPYADQTANHPRAVCFGSARYFLGLLAAAAGDLAAAELHLTLAVERNRAMRALPWLARSLYRYGEFLLTHESGRTSEARSRLLEGQGLAQTLGMAGLARELERLLCAGVTATRFPDGLTAREVDVLRLLAIGRSNKDIAKVLGISLNTVATHVRSILSKTACVNRTEAAAYASRQQLTSANLGGAAEASKALSSL